MKMRFKSRIYYLSSETPRTGVKKYFTEPNDLPHLLKEDDIKTSVSRLDIINKLNDIKNHLKEIISFTEGLNEINISLHAGALSEPDKGLKFIEKHLIQDKLFTQYFDKLLRVLNRPEILDSFETSNKFNYFECFEIYGGTVSETKLQDYIEYLRESIIEILNADKLNTVERLSLKNILESGISVLHAYIKDCEKIKEAFEKDCLLKVSYEVVYPNYMKTVIRLQFDTREEVIAHLERNCVTEFNLCAILELDNDDNEIESKSSHVVKKADRRYYFMDENFYPELNGVHRRLFRLTEPSLKQILESFPSLVKLSDDLKDSLTCCITFHDLAKTFLDTIKMVLENDKQFDLNKCHNMARLTLYGLQNKHLSRVYSSRMIQRGYYRDATISNSVQKNIPIKEALKTSYSNIKKLIEEEDDAKVILTKFHQELETFLEKEVAPVIQVLREYSNDDVRKYFLVKVQGLLEHDLIPVDTINDDGFEELKKIRHFLDKFDEDLQTNIYLAISYEKDYTF